MSMDRCFHCDALIDTDYDDCCYDALPGEPDAAVCERCRDAEGQDD